MTRLRSAVALAIVLPALTVVGTPVQAEAAPAHGVTQTRPTTYTVHGRVVRFGNGRPVQGVRISVTEGNDTDFRGADVTNRNGRFSISFTADDDGFGVLVQGRRVGVQTGWVGCDLTVKATFGAACVHGEKVAPIRVKAV